MWSFLTFESFITQDVLIFFYYMFAIFIPFFLWMMRSYVLKKVPLFGDIDSSLKGKFNALSIGKKLALIALFVMMFLCMELCLRMMFEMMIGYFDMHNYLQGIYEQGQK
jgi:hypothetical protein